MKIFFKNFVMTALVSFCFLGVLICAQQALADNPVPVGGFCTKTLDDDGVWTLGCTNRGCPLIIPFCGITINQNDCTCQ